MLKQFEIGYKEIGCITLEYNLHFFLLEYEDFVKLVDNNINDFRCLDDRFYVAHSDRDYLVASSCGVVMHVALNAILENKIDIEYGDLGNTYNNRRLEIAHNQNSRWNDLLQKIRTLNKFEDIGTLNEVKRKNIHIHLFSNRHMKLIDTIGLSKIIDQSKSGIENLTLQTQTLGNLADEPQEHESDFSNMYGYAIYVYKIATFNSIERELAVVYEQASFEVMNTYLHHVFFQMVGEKDFNGLHILNLHTLYNRFSSSSDFEKMTTNVNRKMIESWKALGANLDAYYIQSKRMQDEEAIQVAKRREKNSKMLELITLFLSVAAAFDPLRSISAATGCNDVWPAVLISIFLLILGCTFIFFLPSPVKTISRILKLFKL